MRKKPSDVDYGIDIRTQTFSRIPWPGARFDFFTHFHGRGKSLVALPTRADVGANRNTARTETQTTEVVSSATTAFAWGYGGQQQTFNNVTDVNGGASPIAGMNVRDALMHLYPGDLIIELVNGTDQGVTTIILTLPKATPCPAGTIDLNLLQFHNSPFGW